MQTEHTSSFRRNLLAWYGRSGRHFPWRNPSATNYVKIISEVLLQRTRAETVATFLPGFLRQYPSWHLLSLAPKQELELQLKPLGLHTRRAAAVSALAAELRGRNGRFPSEREAIEALPGVGQYIANAVELFVHQRPRPLLDVNMARVLERHFGPRKLADIRYDPYLQDLASRVVDCSTADRLNWAILDLAATVCALKTPSCCRCPVACGCRHAAQREGGQSRGNGKSRSSKLVRCRKVFSHVAHQYLLLVCMCRRKKVNAFVCPKHLRVQ